MHAGRKSMKLSIKNLAIVGAVIAAIAGGIWLAKPSEASVCDGWINVITCGTPSHQDLKNVYYGRNDIKALYQWNNINDAMIEGKGMKNGTVYKDGRIVVDGQVVATNAKTVQRNTRYPGSSYGRETVGGHSFYKFTTQNSFVYNQFDAFVWFDENGKFIAAIIKDCGNPVWGDATWKPKDIQVCDLTSKKIITIKETEFNSSKHSKDINDCKEIKVCDLTSKQIVTIKEKEFNSKKHSKDINDCKEIQVCDLSTDTIITIKEKEFDSKKHSKNFADCNKVKVCELETGNIITIKETEFDSKKHSKNEADCDKVKVCHIADKKIVEVTRKESSDSQYTTDMSKCEETPATPPETPKTPTPSNPVELPKTGTGEVVASVVGLGGLTAAASAYIASRKRL